ncbi:MAG: hypothetical protein HFJ75_02970 [Eggerthellaceae bacterium]|nr:hypothetical protein [Eggerthellaceae bacterium]
MVRSKRQTVALALVIPVLALGLPPLLELPGLLAGGPASAAGTAGGLAADVASGLVPFSLDDLISGSMAFTNQNTIYQAGSLLAAEGSVGYALLGIPAAGGLLSCYNGRRGRSLKWLFYAYYPAHLAVIWAIATYLV